MATYWVLPRRAVACCLARNSGDSAKPCRNACTSNAELVVSTVRREAVQRQARARKHVKVYLGQTNSSLANGGVMAVHVFIPPPIRFALSCSICRTRRYGTRVFRGIQRIQAIHVIEYGSTLSVLDTLAVLVSAFLGRFRLFCFSRPVSPILPEASMNIALDAIQRGGMATNTSYKPRYPPTRGKGTRPSATRALLVAAGAHLNPCFGVMDGYVCLALGRVACDPGRFCCHSLLPVAARACLLTVS